MIYQIQFVVLLQTPVCLLFSLIFCLASRILELKHRPFLAQKLEELGTAGGVLGRWAQGPGPVLPGGEAADKAGTWAQSCHSSGRKEKWTCQSLALPLTPRRLALMAGSLGAISGQLGDRIGEPPECVGDADRNFWQHQPPFLLSAGPPNAVPMARSLSLPISWEN